MTKVITIPKEEITLVDREGNEKGMRNTFLHFLGLVLDTAPQRTDTETMIAHDIAMKLPRNGKIPNTLEFEESEITFIQNGITKLRERDGVAGRGWYFLIAPLRDAVLKKK